MVGRRKIIFSKLIFSFRRHIGRISRDLHRLRCIGSRRRRRRNNNIIIF